MEGPGTSWGGAPPYPPQKVLGPSWNINLPANLAVFCMYDHLACHHMFLVFNEKNGVFRYCQYFSRIVCCTNHCLVGYTSGLHNFVCRYVLSCQSHCDRIQANVFVVGFLTCRPSFSYISWLYTVYSWMQSHFITSFYFFRLGNINPLFLKNSKYSVSTKKYKD